MNSKISTNQESVKLAPRVAIVEDQEPMRVLLEEYLTKQGFDVFCFSSPETIIQQLKTTSTSDFSEQWMGGSKGSQTSTATLPTLGELDAILTDIKMPGMDGLEFCRQMKEGFPELPIIVMTAYGSMDTAIEALRAGAYDFITKPVELEVVKASLDRATENRLLRRQIQWLQSQVSPQSFPRLIGESDVMRELKDQLSRVADTKASVLLTGESGVGKELAARAIHESGPRKEQPFVAINCAALPPMLIESELFGHVKGAFTDAHSDRQGLFLQANGGTLFLDEVGELPLDVQPKLLRAIEQQTVRPVGADGPNSERVFDVRLITATNRDLDADVEARRFREDLYYRINVLEITVPPLRSRGMDVLMLAEYYLNLFAEQSGRDEMRMNEAVVKKLLAYDWPGNVRELRNVMERAVVLSQSNVVDLSALPDKIVQHQSDQLVLDDHDNQPLASLSEIESRYIRYVLQQTGGNRTEAAKILGIDRKTLYRRLKEDDDDSS